MVRGAAGCLKPAGLPGAVAGVPGDRGDGPLRAGFPVDPRGYPRVMRVILNVIWLVLSGFWLAIAYVVAGIIACVLIITIPFGIASFRIAAYALWPFGRTTEPRPGAGVASLIGNILWIILFGWELALLHLVSGVALCVTIIGIPLGLANFKMIPISLLPLGVQIVPA